MPGIRRQFSKNLKRLRNRKGYTQEELAEKMNISARYVQKLEGLDCPSVGIDTIEKLCTILGSRPREFFEK